MFSDINDFYTSILSTCNAVVTDKNRILIAHDPNNPSPAIAQGKELVLPTRDNLTNRDYDKDIFFHPLSENIQRGESDVFRFIKTNTVLKISAAICFIGNVLLKLQEDPARQRKMNQEQIDLMLPISSADAKSAANFLKIATQYLREKEDTKKKPLVSIFLKKMGTYNAVTFRRVAVVSFPCYEAIKQGTRFTAGEGSKAKDIARAADYETFQQVMKSIFPGIDNLEDYNHAYDGMIAPIMVAFYRSIGKLSERINYVIDTIEPLAKELNIDVTPGRIPNDWLQAFEDEYMDKLASFKRSVPSLNGNDGELEDRVQLPDRKPSVPAKEVVTPEKRTAEPEVSRRDDRDDAPRPDNKYGIVATWASPQGKTTVKSTAIEDERIERERREREEYEKERRLRREEEERRYEQRQREREDRDVRQPPDRRDDRRDDRDDRSEPSTRTKDGKLNFSALLDRDPYERELKRREEEDRYYEERRREREGRDDRRYRDDDRDYRDSRYDRDDRYDRDRRYRDDDRDDRRIDRYGSDRYRNRDDRRYRDDRDDRYDDRRSSYRDRYR